MIDQADLPTTWRARAELLRQYGAGNQAETLEACAGELEELGYGDDDAVVTLREAAEWSGYGFGCGGAICPGNHVAIAWRFHEKEALELLGRPLRLPGTGV